MSQRKRPAERVSAYQVTAADRVQLVGFGPRYSRNPQDDTTAFGIEHRTTGGYVGVLFERDEFAGLAEWLAADEPELPDAPLSPWVRPTDERGVPVYVQEITRTRSQLRIIDGQTAALFSKRSGGLKVSAWWVGSGSGRTAMLLRRDSELLTGWAADMDAHGWAGWRSGRAAEA